MKTNQLPVSFLLCPRCGRKTRTLVREDTELFRFPLLYPKCRDMPAARILSLLEKEGLITAAQSREPNQ